MPSCCNGVVAVGGMAMAWIGAEGGLAAAREFAVGGQTLAPHANDAVARQFFAHHRWMDLTRAGTRTWFTALCWLPLVLVIWQARRVRKLRQLKEGSGANSSGRNG